MLSLPSARGIGIGRDVRLAQMLIERGVAVDPAAGTDPAVKLKTLLRPA